MSSFDDIIAQWNTPPKTFKDRLYAKLVKECEAEGFGCIDAQFEAQRRMHRAGWREKPLTWADINAALRRANGLPPGTD